jgi:hypothetical protein
MQTVHEDEALAIAPDLDWGRLPDLKYAFRNLSHSVRLKRRTDRLMVPAGHLFIFGL